MVILVLDKPMTKSKYFIAHDSQRAAGGEIAVIQLYWNGLWRAIRIYFSTRAGEDTSLTNYSI